MEETVDNL